MNWFAVLAHHAIRTPDKAITVFEGQPTTYAEMAGRAAALAGGLAARGVGRGDVVALLSYNCPEFLETIFATNHLGAIAMPINWRLAAPEVRYILEHSGAAASMCDESLVELANDATKGIESTLVRACVSTSPDGWTALADLRADATAIERARTAADDIHRLMYTSGTTGRPKGVMLTHANLAWKNLAHLVEFGFTNEDLGLACGPLYHVGGARPHDDDADRRRRDDDHPSRLRRRERRRRARTVAGHDGVARTRDGQRDHGAARHRTARPVVGAGDHQRRREDADPAHRTAAADVPVRLVRRCVRPDRDRLGRHVPRPRQHRDQARQRRPAMPLPRARHLERRATIGARGRARRDRHARTEGVQGLLA